MFYSISTWIFLRNGIKKKVDCQLRSVSNCNVTDIIRLKKHRDSPTEVRLPRMSRSVSGDFYLARRAKRETRNDLRDERHTLGITSCSRENFSKRLNRRE